MLSGHPCCKYPLPFIPSNNNTITDNNEDNKIRYGTRKIKQGTQNNNRTSGETKRKPVDITDKLNSQSIKKIKSRPKDDKPVKSSLFKLRRRPIFGQGRRSAVCRIINCRINKNHKCCKEEDIIEKEREKESIETQEKIIEKETKKDIVEEKTEKDIVQKKTEKEISEKEIEKKISEKVKEEGTSERIIEEETERITREDILTTETIITEVQTVPIEDVDHTMFETITEASTNKEYIVNEDSESQTTNNYEPDGETTIDYHLNEITTQTSEMILHKEENFDKEAVVVSKEESTSLVETKIVKAALHEVNDKNALSRMEYQKVYS